MGTSSTRVGTNRAAVCEFEAGHKVARFPFVAYGLALGDIVLLNENDYVSEWLGPCGIAFFGS